MRTCFASQSSSPEVHDESILLTIKIRFLNGAYHATPWGKHVNEGVPEWPPSVWRLVRAMISSWKTVHPEMREDEVWPILQKLTCELPSFELPDASVSHTRHYMPTDGNPTLIMSTFVVMGDEPTYIVWDGIELDQSQRSTLERIVGTIHYFGRAESWCSISIDDSSRKPNCRHAGDHDLDAEKDMVRVLVPREKSKFVDLCAPAKDLNNKVLDAVTVTTGQLQDNNYIDPPGAKWVYYLRPANCFEAKLAGSTKTSRLPRITLVRYAVGGTIMPSIKDTMRVADLMRSACMAKYGKYNGKSTSHIFSGKDGSGKPLVGHGHASYLPTYEAQNRVLDHITVVAKDGFGEKELDALLSLRKLYRPGIMDIHLIFQGCGSIGDFPDVQILKQSRTWLSSTPLILTRHTKHRGKGGDKDGPEDQIRAEVRNRYCDASSALLEVDCRCTDILGTNIKPHDFFRWRRHGSVGDGKTYSVRLKFKEPVRGPITLGYGSHFGLGMFVPEDSRT